MRQCGVLLHISSLPDRGGIGTLGAEAYRFVDFCEKAGLRIWQMLPVGPTGYGESPYQSTSCFAGNELLIDLRELANEAALKPPVLPDGEKVDFAVVRAQKTAFLHTLYEKVASAHAYELAAFRKDQPWVEDYALFCAIKESCGGVMWTDWPDRALRERQPEALRRATQELSAQIGYHVFVQWMFYSQWKALRTYANAHGVKLFGDMPIYISEDSVDTWMHRELFQLGKDGKPTAVAGVPPDAFTDDGQRWGNPLYNWKAHRKQHFAWWTERMRAASALFDIVRIDHFIGLANYYSIPAQYANARIGRWRVTPGRRLFHTLRRELPELNIVAEDLGVINYRVRRLLRYCGCPGMRMISFAFNDDPKNGHLPANYPENCYAYTGTHDNDTARGWFTNASPEARAQAEALLHISTEQEAPRAFIRAVAESKAASVVFPMQDFLELPSSARMNIPGTIGGDNWAWRMLPNADSDALAARIRSLLEETDRL